MHVGLLWDSVSNNVGDQAIGLVLQRVLDRHDIPHRTVDPFDPDTREAAMLVIGGGELIRAPGHPFYDAFRVPGPHVLNTVGVIDGSQTAYLDEYRMVTVRSGADALELRRGEVAPCLTLLYDRYLPPGEPPVPIPDGAIGFHITYPFAEHCITLVEWLRHAGVGPIVWLPVTHYNADYVLMEALAAQVPGSTLLPRMSPDDTFRTIGRLRALVSSSLHATLFAYAQDVPFLVANYPSKISYFLTERDLHRYTFQSAAEIAQRLPALLSSRPHFAERERDQQRSAEVADRIVGHASDALRGAAKPAAYAVPPAHRAAYEHEMQMYHTVTQLTARLVTAQADLVASQAELAASQAALAQITRTRLWRAGTRWWALKARLQALPLVRNIARRTGSGRGGRG